MNAGQTIILAIREAIQRRVMGSEAKKTPVLLSKLGGATLILDAAFRSPVEILRITVAAPNQTDSFNSTKSIGLDLEGFDAMAQFTHSS